MKAAAAAGAAAAGAAQGWPPAASMSCAPPMSVSIDSRQSEVAAAAPLMMGSCAPAGPAAAGPTWAVAGSGGDDGPWAACTSGTGGCSAWCQAVVGVAGLLFSSSVATWPVLAVLRSTAVAPVLPGLACHALHWPADRVVGVPPCS